MMPPDRKQFHIAATCFDHSRRVRTKKKPQSKWLKNQMQIGTSSPSKLFAAMPQKRLWDLIWNSPVERCSFLTLFDFTGHCSTLFVFTGHCSIFYSTLFDLSEIFRFYRELAEASRTTTKFDIICKIPQPGQPPNIIENTTNLSIVDLYSPYRFVESLVVGLSINQTKNGYVSMYVKYPKWVKVKKIEVKFTLTLPYFYHNFTTSNNGKFSIPKINYVIFLPKAIKKREKKVNTKLKLVLGAGQKPKKSFC